ncbi:heme exporter protein CcmB [Pelosinus propionicus]|uniref:Heme exporter protein B n=1 Tax=Pelosinus propionicus DSM 13327 TaxID=1123291 RepID=A0A1I4PCK7_9FIRM|nr:heme exporter protein CcmB [Pelosinus propionicus]SFM25489.1 heme exporter protein B [Pelosinus propionicus DSM 13327]
MPITRLSLFNRIWAIMMKDGICEFRTRYAVSALLMFALISLASISMAIGAARLPEDLTAALLWILLFFCAMAGLSRVFVQEQESGTILALQIYGSGQAVLFGKLLFNTFMLLTLTVLIIPLFIVFLNIEIYHWSIFLLVLILGDIGIAAASTVTAAMVAKTQGKHALFTVMTFPILLPQFLSSISTTAKILMNVKPDVSDIMFMAAYNVVLMIASSILFDYLWYD